MVVYVVEYDVTFGAKREHRIDTFVDREDFVNKASYLKGKFYISNVVYYSGNVSEVETPLKESV